MSKHESSSRQLWKRGGSLFGHGAAIVLGFGLMILGLGLGVSIVALPVGLLVGLAGILLLLWGLFVPVDKQA